MIQGVSQSGGHDLSQWWYKSPQRGCIRCYADKHAGQHYVVRACNGDMKPAWQRRGRPISV